MYFLHQVRHVLELINVMFLNINWLNWNQMNVNGQITPLPIVVFYPDQVPEMRNYWHSNDKNIKD